MSKKSNISGKFHINFSLSEAINWFFVRIKSIKMALFLFTAIIALVPMGIILLIVHNSYEDGLVESQIAAMQIDATIIASDYAQYTTINEANKAGISSIHIRYSTINSVRIRALDNDFVIRADSYSIDNGKSVINERAIKTLTTGKNVAQYDSETGTLEAVVPIYNVSEEIIGVLIVDKDIAEITSVVKRISEHDITVLVAISVLLIAIIYTVYRFMAKSVSRVFTTVEKIAEGHTDRRIETRGWTEVKEFANDFNMIMDKASVLDESRQEFVSNVSHELKTPITSIKVLADSLNMQEDVPVELYKEFMQDITDEIDRESKIIDDLLALVKMDKDSSALNISAVNLNELIEIILKRLKPLAQKKNVEILFESFRPVVAQIDESKFIQVISNLVENAIKYNKQDGWVHVSLNADYQYFYVRIEDSGIGIPQESQDKVFDRFYRVDKARSRETGGTGLGLAIVQKIILMHHGTIKMHSEEGAGTTFTVRIPLNYIG
ncbi:MAG: GHKL domain-containing protein [Lachnospira sp.]|nr:GHKL domain-containing protein [Lachnospira sp.]